METTAVVTTEREQNKTMLAELLEKVREYDGLLADCAMKRARVEELEERLKTPAPKLKFWKTFFLGIITLTVYWFVALISQIVKKKRWRQLLASTQVELEDAQAILATAEAVAEEYYNGPLAEHLATVVPERFPMSYALNASAIESMIELFDDHRADSVKEVINLYEELLYRNRLETVLSCISSHAEVTAISSTRSAIASERSAKANERAAAASEATAVAAAASAASMASMARSAKRSAAAAERMANS